MSEQSLRATEVRRLLTDWIDAKSSVIHEFSADLEGDHLELLADAKIRAEALGIPWDDAIVPTDVTEFLTTCAWTRDGA